MAELLFRNYPRLHQAYKHTMEFRSIYEQTVRDIAEQKFIDWINKITELKMTVFNTRSQQFTIPSGNNPELLHKKTYKRKF